MTDLVRTTKRDDALFYGAAGSAAAIVLGVMLVPMRESFAASNLTYPFVILTAVIARLGGPWAAVATAIVSSLSLDFFLTKPYMTLAIEAKHDVIAFLGLTACGLVVAMLSAVRGRKQHSRGDPQ